MIESFLFLLVSVMAAIGMAIILVEKGKDFPVKGIRIRIQWLLRKIYWKLPWMLFCTTCTSFWSALICDIILCIIGICLGVPYFLWPLSGFIAAGATWIVIEFLNAIDKQPNINVFADKE